METSCECPETTVIPIITHSQTSSHTSRTSTCIIQGSIKEVFITVTSIVTTSIVTTSTVTTSTVMRETPVQFADQKSDNCQKELTAAIVVPVIIILILIVLTVTVLIVYVTRKGKRYVYVNKCIIVLIYL